MKMENKKSWIEWKQNKLSRGPKLLEIKNYWRVKMKKRQKLKGVKARSSHRLRDIIYYFCLLVF